MQKTPLPIKTVWDENKSFFDRLTNSLRRRWAYFWAKYAGISTFGRLFGRLALLTAPPHKAGTGLAAVARCGFFIAPGATIYHSNLIFGKNVYIGDRVILYQAMLEGKKGGELVIGDNVCILRDTVLETGMGASITIGDGTYIHPRCQINAYKSSIEIGKCVDIAPNCAFYSYDHGIKAGKWIREQPLTSKGPIVIEDEVWIGVGVIVLSGVRIGKGAVIGAGSVVSGDIPPDSIACGASAKKIRDRL
jgi:acetyltransferase-like isoleucine patch superfamily enzyme